MWGSRFASRLAPIAAVCLLLAAPGLAANEVETSFSHRLAQGRFLLEQGMNAQALIEFRAAAKMPTGRSNPEVHTLVARTAYLLGDVASAVDAVRTAKAVTEGTATPELAELHDFLTSRFGKVLVIGAGSQGASVPEPAVPILDPPTKRAYSFAIDRLAAPATTGSTSIWLPVGSYRVGGLLIEVRAEGTTRMDLRGGVGDAGGGVYGETRSRGGRGPGLEASLAVRVGGMGLGQQGNGTGGGRFLLAMEAQLPDVLGFRVGGGLAVTRAERLVAVTSAPAALRPFVQGGVGGLIPIGPVRFAPWVVFELGYTRPLEAGLPAGYQGPYEYLVFGPDLETRLLLPTTETAAGLEITPEFTLRLVVRETRPLGVAADDDARPHLTIGAGFDVGLRFGGGS
jgi:hypothetical protein